jgi:hypothetical protein
MPFYYFSVSVKLRQNLHSNCFNKALHCGFELQLAVSKTGVPPIRRKGEFVRKPRFEPMSSVLQPNARTNSAIFAKK